MVVNFSIPSKKKSVSMSSKLGDIWHFHNSFVAMNNGIWHHSYLDCLYQTCLPVRGLCSTALSSFLKFLYLVPRGIKITLMMCSHTGKLRRMGTLTTLRNMWWALDLGRTQWFLLKIIICKHLLILLLEHTPITYRYISSVKCMYSLSDSP